MQRAHAGHTQCSGLNEYQLRRYRSSQLGVLRKKMKSKQQIFTTPMAKAWREAAKDLGIGFISPYPLEHLGKTYWCSGLLPDFGWPKGTVIIGRFEDEKAIEVADELEFFASGLNPYYYESYNRDLFLGTLCDWGWEGLKEEAPSWYDPTWRDNRNLEEAKPSAGEDSSYPTD